MVKETLPIDYGHVHTRHLILMNVFIFILYSYDWTKTIVSLILFNLYTMVIVRSLIYQEDDIISLVFQFFVSTIVMAYYCAIVHFMLSWIGFQYVAAELPHESNKQLLNNLQEGLLIVREDNKEVLFQNSAAIQIKTSLESECAVTSPASTASPASTKNFFDLAQCNYRQIDLAEFKKAESAEDCLKVFNEDKNTPVTNMEQIIEK